MQLPESSQAVRVRVPAKVNLHLGVGPVRADGYHTLTTVFQAVGIYDELIARPGKGVSLTVSGEGADEVPADAENLAWQAAELLAAHAGVPADVAIELRKAIPVAGGMAGGSADAAGALLACAALWQTGTSKREFHELAADLGSDVAFPLHGGTALGTGRGERLSSVLSTGEYHWVFAMSDFGISAARAYRQLDLMRETRTAPTPIGPPDQVLDALRAGDCGRLADALANDLQPAVLALHPELRDVLDTGEDLGALAGFVSGSGPTIAFLTADAEAAATLADDLAAVRVCHAVTAAAAPSPGARVVG